MKLMEFLIDEAIIYDLKSRDKLGALREMVEALRGAQKISAKDTESILEALAKREKLGSTGIGGGVAVPHTKHSSVGRLLGTLARSKVGIDFDALDGEPVHLLFLLLSPSESSSSHLAALERIATLIRDNDFRRFMSMAHNKKEMIEILKEKDGHHL
jgi:PTS system fructose-specific IIA component/PTS system nitrogen regulatory IIA component